MAKIIIPASSLPTTDVSGINVFRFRIVNNNRNLFSDWSVAFEIDRETSASPIVVF